jgi:hypothetical protein
VGDELGRSESERLIFLVVFLHVASDYISRCERLHNDNALPVRPNSSDTMKCAKAFFGRTLYEQASWVRLAPVAEESGSDR